MTGRVAWLVVVGQLAAAIGHADPVDPPRPVDPADDSAPAYLERGIAAYRARDFERAVNELLRANQLAPQWPDPYHWLALAEAEIDDCRSAVINIDTFVSRVAAGDPRVAELVAVRERCQRGQLSVDSTPAGATIRIDDGPVVGTTPAKRLAIRVGDRTVTVEKPGFEAQSRRITVGASGTDHASFVLTGAPDKPVYRRGWFWVAIGAVAITAIGVTYATSGAGQHDDPRLPTVTCDATGCRP
jgi:hypothetical protein